MNDLIVHAQCERDERTGLDELAVAQLRRADILEENLVEMIEAIRGAHGADIHLLTAVADALFAVDFSAADPGNQSN